MKRRLAGILTPITTPFENEMVSYQQLKSNMKKFRNTRLNGYFALGSNGESKFLTELEKLKILEVVLQEKADHQVVIASTDYESTRQTIVFSKQVAETGVDYISILPPFYFKKHMTDDSIVGYYTDVAEAVSVPVVAYNAPSFTGLTLSLSVIEKISQHQNIIGMKDTSNGNMSGYLSVCGDDFDILSGTVSTLFTAMLLGAKGGVISLANAFPDICCELYKEIMTGDIESARRIYYLLFGLNRSVSGRFGVAGVKYAMTIAGYYGGNPRRPLLPLNGDEQKYIFNAISKTGILHHCEL